MSPSLVNFVPRIKLQLMAYRRGPIPYRAIGLYILSTKYYTLSLPVSVYTVDIPPGGKFFETNTRADAANAAASATVNVFEFGGP